MKKEKTTKLRSSDWFNDKTNPVMTALYLERYLNYGLTVEELQSSRPVIGIAQTGSDLAPCNRHHLELAKRIKDGIRDSGGIAIEFPVHPIQGTGRRPTAALDRNLQCLSLIEVLHGYPIDGVVLTTGCEKTTAALLMGAASVNLPAIAFSVGPMLNGFHRGESVGSGTATSWRERQKFAAQKDCESTFVEIAAASASSTGHCNTMGVALTLNCLVEGLGMALPGSATIPAPYRERQQMAFSVGKRIVDMVWSDVTPKSILTKQAFHNAIILCSAIGGEINAPFHINAIARHAGIALTMDDWQQVGQNIPQIVNCQPTGEYLAEEFHKAGGVAAVISELLNADLLHSSANSVTGQTLQIDYRDKEIFDSKVVRKISNPIRSSSNLIVMRGNLFESAVVKASAIDEEFRTRYLTKRDDPNALEGSAAVFDGPEDYRARIEDPSLLLDENSILVIRGIGPKGCLGSAEVVNMKPPTALMQKGIAALPIISDGWHSSTASALSILNASPEAAAGGKLAILRTGDRIRIDLNTRRVDVLLPQEEILQRENQLRCKPTKNQTWWQKVYQDNVSKLDDGAIFDGMIAYTNTGEKKPRHSH